MWTTWFASHWASPPSFENKNNFCLALIICKSSFLLGQYASSSSVSIASSLSLLTYSVPNSSTAISAIEGGGCTARTSTSTKKKEAAPCSLKQDPVQLNVDSQSLLPIPWKDHRLQLWRLSGFHSILSTFENNSKPFSSLLHPKLQLKFAFLVAKISLGEFFLLNTSDYPRCKVLSLPCF